MGRKSIVKHRKKLTKKVNIWLAELLVRLQEEDLEKLTIDDIAKLAGKSKSTIYEYFERKEDILLAACQIRVKALSALISKKEGQTGNPIAKYEHLVEDFTEGIADISISFLENIKQHYTDAWAVINEFTTKFVELLKELYEEGMDKGYYCPISVELLAHLDKYFITQVVTNQSIFSDSNYTLSNLVRDYLNLRLNGLVRRD